MYKRQPSYALLIADTAIEMGYDPATEFQISGGIFGAEPCSENMRQEIADKLGIQYCDVYGLSEIMGPGVAMECAERGGLHIAEDQFYCEIIDPETLEVLPDGEVGELVITTLTRECSPMIRYRTRDVTTINAEPDVYKRQIMNTLLTDTSVKNRTVGVGHITTEDAAALSMVGPFARASNLPYDVRSFGRGAYGDLADFAPITATEGDCYARVKVRCLEAVSYTHLSNS